MQFDPKSNSIGFLRLFLALAVIYAHAYELGGFGHDFIYHLSGDIFSIGAIAVDGFFCLSGYLITSSYLRLQSLPNFLWHRVLRIFPAYWVCLIVIGIGMPLLFGKHPDFGYIQHNFLVPLVDVFRAISGFTLPLLSGGFLSTQTVIEKIPLLQGQGTIPTLLANNAINGSLWTLQEEFRAYILVGALGWFGLLRKNVVFGLLCVTGSAYALFSHKYGLPGISPIRLSAFFLMGATFYFWKPPLEHSLAVAAIVVGFTGLAGRFYPVVAPLTTTYLMMYLATVLPFTGVAKARDYSYGLYIYAFPVQQALTAYHLNQGGFLVYFALSVGCTFMLAALSWHLVESLSLRWKNEFLKKKQPGEFA